MKIPVIAILITCFISCFCLQNTRIKKFKQQLLTVPENLESSLVFIQFYEDYPEAILLEINSYLALYQQPELAWSDQLKETSKLAAKEIIDDNSFGQHSRIEQWQNEVPNDIFTEMCFNVNVSNSNFYSKSLSSKTQKIMYDTKMSVGTIMKTLTAPTAQMFAKNILESLESEHLLLTLNEYTHCGISITALDQAKHPNEYLAVMHLIKASSDSAPTNVPKVFTSCKDAKDKGVTDTQITITLNGVEKQVECNPEQGGGWTLIHTEKNDYTTNATVSINDQGLDYSEIFIKAADSHFLDYDKNNNQVWKSKGFNFGLNMFKFGDSWYISENLPTTWDRQSSLNQISNIKKFSIPAEIQQVTKSSECQFEAANTNFLDYCSQAFIIKKQAGGRLLTISDYESFFLNQSADNSMHYEFQVYVR